MVRRLWCASLSSRLHIHNASCSPWLPWVRLRTRAIKHLLELLQRICVQRVQLLHLGGGMRV